MEDLLLLSILNSSLLLKLLGLLALGILVFTAAWLRSGGPDFPATH